MNKIFIVLTLAVIFSGCTSSPEREFIKEVSKFSNYSTVNWESTINQYYIPNKGDWKQDFASKLNVNFPEYEASVAYRLLQIARSEFHQKSLPLRVVASDDVIEAMDATEAMFDTVFIRYIGQEYYLGLLNDTYTEIMESAMDNLVEELRRINSK